MESGLPALRVSRDFLRATGVLGIVAGVLTCSLLILPLIYGEPRSFDDQIAIHSNPLFQLDQWLRFINVFAILTVSWGLAAHRLHHSPGAASTGMLFILIYAAAELLGRSAMIVARGDRWISGFVGADAQTQTELMTLIRGFDAVWSGWFVLILLTFTISSVLFGWATRGGPKLQRATSFLLFAAAALGVMTLVAIYLPPLRGVASWGYVVVQPTSRLVMGIFLWSEAGKCAT